MAAINDGGAAFPASIAITPAGDVFYGESGMSLRDWFAGQALAGMVGTTNDAVKGTSQVLAAWAYQLADSMLAARAQPQEAQS